MSAPTAVKYYKATDPRGFDFFTGEIDYGSAFKSGEILRHPERQKVSNDASTYFSISVSAADCIGFSWPCRLFRVEPVGRILSGLSASPNKRAVSALRVVEELPAWQVFGPQGRQVVWLITDRHRRFGEYTLSQDKYHTLEWALDLVPDRGEAIRYVYKSGVGCYQCGIAAVMALYIVRDLIPPGEFQERIKLFMPIDLPPEDV